PRSSDPDPDPWAVHSALATATPDVRLRVIRAVLDYMRRALAISVECLAPDRQDVLWRRVRETLKEPWTFDENETLRPATRFVLFSDKPLAGNDTSLGPRSALGRYLRARETWGHLSANVSEEQYRAFVQE